jgi:hypothetical protein
MFFGAFTVLCDWIAESLPAAPFSVNVPPPLNVILSNEWDLYISVPPNTSGQQRTTSMTLGEATLTLTQPPK